MKSNAREEISNRINIVDLIGQYVTLKRAGTKYIGLCPFHNEKTPSFSVTPERNLFYCFGCHKGGTIFDFVMEMENMTFPEALKFLGKKAGVEVNDRFENSGDNKKREALKELYRRVAGSFHYILKTSGEAEVARAYLKLRGLTDEVIEKFQIGWAPVDRSWLRKFLTEKGYSKDFLEESGIFSSRGIFYPLFSARIMFPITNNIGDVIAFSGRTLEDNGPKYINSPETEIFLKKSNLYGLSHSIKSIRENKNAVLCEGQLDVISMHQAGINNAVAPLGTAYTDNQANVLKRYADKILICFDGDSAGKKATKKAIITCEKNNLLSEVIILPEKADPADILLNEGEKALQKVLKSTINSFDYILDNAAEESDISTPEGKEAVINRLEEYLNSLSSEVRKNSCMTEIADRLGVDFYSVSTDVTKRGRNPGKVSQHETKTTNKSTEISAEMFLMIALASNREQYPYVRKRIDTEDLLDGSARGVYIALEECYRKNLNGLEDLFDRIEDREVVSLLTQKLTSGEYSINSEEIIKDTVKKIKNKSLLRKKEEIVLKLKKLSKENNEEDEVKLLSEKIFIDREIEKLRLGI